MGRLYRAVIDTRVAMRGHQARPGWHASRNRRVMILADRSNAR